MGADDPKSLKKSRSRNEKRRKMFSLALLRPTGANYLRMLKPRKPATASKSMSSGPAKGDNSYYLVKQKEWWIEKAVQVTVVFGLWQVFRTLVKKQEEKIYPQWVDKNEIRKE